VRLALALRARGREAVVINADSAQVYADLAVLSARPTASERQGIEHRLFGEWDAAEPCSAVVWARAARAAIAACHARGAVPILAGGTGLYLTTLLHGIAPIPPIDPEVRAGVRALSLAEARAALASEDPRRAARLSPHDGIRIARALEVLRATGRSLTEWQAGRVGGIGGQVCLSPLILLPPRAWLYPRCDQRFARMLQGGAVPEVERLLARGLDPKLPVMRAIGVAEIAALLGGELTQAQALERGARATRNYAKRQYTWFHHQTDPAWPRTEGQDHDLSVLFALLLRD